MGATLGPNGWEVEEIVAPLVRAVTDPGTERKRTLTAAARLFPVRIEHTWQDINVPMQSGCTLKPIYRCYIDAVNGDDSWDGSVPAWTSGTVGPKRTAVVGNWTGTKTSWFSDEILLFRAGQTHTLTATGASIGLTTRKHLGAYWLPNDTGAAKPTIRSLNNAGSAGSASRACISASGTLSDISVSDITIDTSDVPNRCGLSFYQTAAAQSINNISVINVDVTGGTITDAACYGGIKFEYFGQSATLTAYPVSKNILVHGGNVTGYPGHGIVTSGTLGEQLANGRWHGVDVVNCTVDGCGAGYDSHAFTSYSGGVNLWWTSGGWTNSASTIYWMDIDSKYGRDIPDIEMLYYRTSSGGEVFKLLKNTATPSTPAVGEFGFDGTGGTGNLKLYINVGVAMTGTDQIATCVRPVRGVRYIRCTAKNMVQAGRSGSLEGHGFAFDDFASNCSVIECQSIDNLGCGITINLGDNNQVVGSIAYGNGLAAIKGNFGWGNYIGKCDLTGAGYSNTLPPYLGFVHLSAASHKAMYSYAGALPGPNTYSNEIASSNLSYTGTDTTVALLLGGSSPSAPQLFARDCNLEPGVGRLTDGRVTVIGRRSTAYPDLPDQVRGIGVQA